MVQDSNLHRTLKPAFSIHQKCQDKLQTDRLINKLNKTGTISDKVNTKMLCLNQVSPNQFHKTITPISRDHTHPQFKAQF